MQFVDANTIRSVPYQTAMDAITETFRSPAELVDRIGVSAPSGDLLLMPATSASATGVKLVTVTPDNAENEWPVVQAIYALFDGPTGAPRAILDGTALTTLRTASVSAIYSQVLARPDSTRLGIFGAGVQAESHIRAHVETWPDLTDITVTSRSAATARRLIERCSDVAVPIRAGSPEEVANADIVCGCTSATEPVIPTGAVRPGTHLNLIGAYRLDMREAPSNLMGKASVYVEDREAIRHEAGDIAFAVDDGAMDWSDVRGDLFELAAGSVRRSDDNEITLFKGVGLALEDLAVATAILNSP